MLGREEVEGRFGFHKATIEGPNATVPHHTLLRQLFKNFANALDEIIDDGRYKSLAMSDLEQASMWAHKAIAEKAPLIVE